ncbi:MAG: hypothetical protein PHT02_00975 [Tissierellia bacterium]|nr:hypothetical protein [Tissierellia bacterium]
MKKWLKCDECLNGFQTKGDKVYIITIREDVFIEDNNYQDGNSYRKLQLCENCFDKNSLKKILEERDRQFPSKE